MNNEVFELWGEELAWISDDELRQKTSDVWKYALENSVLSAADLNTIPFTLLCGPDLKVTFMDHKRSVVHIAKNAGEKINSMYHGELTINMDVLLSGAILCDVGKLLEYEKDEEGKVIQGKYGKYLRHPFSGVSIAEKMSIPASVCHIIATHAGEGNLVKRTTEAYIVHHADFMTFLPFKERLID